MQKFLPFIKDKGQLVLYVRMHVLISAAGVWLHTYYAFHQETDRVHKRITVVLSGYIDRLSDRGSRSRSHICLGWKRRSMLALSPSTRPCLSQRKQSILPRRGLFLHSSLNRTIFKYIDNPTLAPYAGKVEGVHSHNPSSTPKC